jgi:hypothetical protein
MAQANVNIPVFINVRVESPNSAQRKTVFEGTARTHGREVTAETVVLISVMGPMATRTHFRVLRAPVRLTMLPGPVCHRVLSHGMGEQYNCTWAIVFLTPIIAETGYITIHLMTSLSNELGSSLMRDKKVGVENETRRSQDKGTTVHTQGRGRGRWTFGAR